jgi:hypothetical protein
MKPPKRKSAPRAKKKFRAWAILEPNGSLYDVALDYEMALCWSGRDGAPYHSGPTKTIRRCTVTLDERKKKK